MTFWQGAVLAVCGVALLGVILLLVLGAGTGHATWPDEP